MSAQEGERKSVWLLTYSALITLLLTFFISNMAMLSEEEQTIYQNVDKILGLTGMKIIEKIGADSTFRIQKDTKGIRITIQSAKLFDVNKAVIKPEFKDELLKLGEAIAYGVDIRSSDNFHTIEKVLSENKKRLLVKIRVEGHTDNQIVTRGKYADNLELSSFRAVSVARFFHQELNLSYDNLTAEGRGEFEPIADNFTADGRARNRRVEIYVDSDIIDVN